MEPDNDVMITYRGLHGCASVCRVRIFERPDKTIVVFSEIKENPGTSVQNAHHTLLPTLFAYLERPEKPIVWVEHWDSNSYRGGREREDFTLVTPQIVNGHWRTSQRHMPLGELEAHIGGTWLSEHEAPRSRP